MILAYRKWLSGITLLELLVGTAIFAFLVGLLIPAVQRARESVARLKCSNNLKQIALGVETYHDSHRVYPATFTWLADLRPYYEASQVAGDQPIPTISCPSDPRGAVTRKTATQTIPLSWYVAPCSGTIAHDTGPISRTSIPARSKLAISDGTSNTLLIAERPPSPTLLYGYHPGTGLHDAFSGVRNTSRLYLFTTNNPITGSLCPTPATFGPGRHDNYCSVNSIWSPHRGGSNFAFADGSVRFLEYSITNPIPDLPSTTLLQALVTRDGDECVSVP